MNSVEFFLEIIFALACLKTSYGVYKEDTLKVLNPLSIICSALKAVFLLPVKY